MNVLIALSVVAVFLLVSKWLYEVLCRRTEAEVARRIAAIHTLVQMGVLPPCVRCDTARQWDAPGYCSNPRCGLYGTGSIAEGFDQDRRALESDWNRIFR